MIKKRETPSTFVKIPKTHVFAMKRTIYSFTEGKEKEEWHLMQKLGSDKAMTMDKSVIVHMYPDDVVHACDIVKAATKQAS